jgi:hypothetical protein
MHKLIERLRFANFSAPEPNPWFKKDVLLKEEVDDEDNIPCDMRNSIYGSLGGDLLFDETDDDSDEDEQEGQSYLMSVLSSCSIM